jgi:hypothetical protein
MSIDTLAVPMQRTIADELPLLPLGWRLTLSEVTRIDVDGVYALGVGRGGGRRVGISRFA